MLGLEAERNVRTFRAIAGAAAPLTAGRARARRSGRGDLRGGAAPPLRARPGPRSRPKPAEARARAEKPHGTDDLEAALRAAGARYEDAIVREARRHGVPVSLVCAVLEVETGFQNVFGHDKVRNPIKSPPRGLLAVTEERYKQYLHFRRQGLGNQGVGPMQLTSPGLQDRADALGGCWKVDPNIRVGVEYLAGNIQRLGLQRGVAAYNGSLDVRRQGPAAGEAVAREARPAPPRTGAVTGGAGPRTLRVRNPRMRGSDVAGPAEADQPALRGVEDRPAHRRGRRVRARDAQGGAPRGCTGSGSPTADYERGITPALRSKMRRPSRRTRRGARAREGPPAVAAQAPRHAAKRRRVGGSGNYPLGVHGPIIGTPFHGTHTRGNWQSDNAHRHPDPERDRRCSRSTTA